MAVFKKIEHIDGDTVYINMDHVLAIYVLKKRDGYDVQILNENEHEHIIIKRNTKHSAEAVAEYLAGITE